MGSLLMLLGGDGNLLAFMRSIISPPRTMMEVVVKTCMTRKTVLLYCMWMVVVVVVVVMRSCLWPQANRICAVPKTDVWRDSQLKLSCG